MHDAGGATLRGVLLDGINHVTVLTSDTDRLVEFYESVFDATHAVVQEEDGFRLTIVFLGGTSELNVFELAGNAEAERQVPMFGRGRLDHVGFSATDVDTFAEVRDRLIARGATDGFVTDFGHVLSVFFRDPDGLGPEACTLRPIGPRRSGATLRGCCSTGSTMWRC